MTIRNSYSNGVMSPTPRVSINPLIEFVDASNCKKVSIVRKQKHPSTFVVAPYGTARAALKRYVKTDFDKTCIYDAISRLQSRDNSTSWKSSDTANSIHALKRFIDSNFPSVYGKIRCSFPKPEFKNCFIGEVDVTVAPDLVLRWEVDNVSYLGAVKFRLSQSSINNSSGFNAAAILAHYLRTSVATPDEIVDCTHCLFVDVMSDRIYTAPSDITPLLKVLEEVCEEYGQLWRAA